MASALSSPESSYLGQASDPNFSSSSPSSSTTSLSSPGLSLTSPPPPRSSSSPSPYASLSFVYSPSSTIRVNTTERNDLRRSRYAELDSVSSSTSSSAMAMTLESPGSRVTPEVIQARREAEIARALDWLSSHPDISIAATFPASYTILRSSLSVQLDHDWMLNLRKHLLYHLSSLQDVPKTRTTVDFEHEQDC